jgi:hypothetical protein
MQPLLTKEQARAVTRGRTPLVPIEYEEAIRSLQACVTLDEAKYWGDKADALAAWAKIYHSGDALRKAKQLKLHAFRRMGELASELRPQAKVSVSTGGQRFTNGPNSLLKEIGLTPNEASAATFISRLPKKAFEQEIDKERPRTPMVYRRSFFVTTDWDQVQLACWQFKSKLKPFLPKDVARSVSKEQTKVAKELVQLLIDWLDEFEEALPK